MLDSQETTMKQHYICQTYVEKQGVPGGLQVDKLFQYTTAAEAQNRAEREANSTSSVGADAYMVSEDLSSGEVGPPVFLGRHGNVPEGDDF